MTAKMTEGRELDDLIKKAFADDLPAGVEAGMRERIERFRAAKAADEGRAAAWAWLSRRAVWAVLSVLMLVTGLLLQGLGSRNSLADRVTQFKIEFANAGSGRGPGAAPEDRPVDPARSPLIRRMNHE